MTDVGKRIRQMVEFIKQEAKEKAEELATKSEAEFQREKMNLVEKEKINIRKAYDRKLGEIETQRKIELSREINSARLKLLRERDANMKAIHEDAYKNLMNLKNGPSYKEMLKKMLIQSLILMHEDDITVRSTKADNSTVSSILKDAVNTYKKMWKDQTGNSRDHVGVSLDKYKFIPDSKVGGIVLYARGEAIVYDNSLQARLDMVEQALLPITRGKVYGVKQKMGMTGEYH